MKTKSNKIALFVKGVEYKLFTEIAVKRNLKTMVSSFEFIATNEDMDSFIPIKIWDDCIVKVNDITVLTGYVDKIAPHYDNTSHSVNIGGYDITKNVVDTSLFNNSVIKSKAPVAFKKIIEDILKANGITNIKVKDEAEVDSDVFVTPYLLSQIGASEISLSVFDYIQVLAQETKVLINTDGLGNIIIYRNVAPDKTNLKLTNIRGNKSNSIILSARCEYNYSKVFRDIIVKTQFLLNMNLEGKDDDPSVKQPRTKVIISNSISDVLNLDSIAVWEMNNRRANAIKYICTVSGFWAGESDIFRPNQFFMIRDDYCDVNNMMLLNEVKYNYNEVIGSTADLTFITADAYTLQAEDPHTKSKLGNKLLGV